MTGVLTRAKHNENLPLGARGKRPITFQVPSTHSGSLAARSIPGVRAVTGGIACAWDAAPLVGEALGMYCPPPPTDGGFPTPGLEDYYKTRFKDILYPYQKDGVLFLARRHYAMLCDEMRMGKTLQALAASVLAGCKHVLVLAPALAKWVWAREILKWLGEPSLILEGRSAREARLVCTTCGGRIEMPDGRTCTDCTNSRGLALGVELINVQRVNRDVILRGPERIGPRGSKKPGPRYCPVPRQWHCPRHPKVRATDNLGWCNRCRQNLTYQLMNARFTIANYDILSAQVGDMGDGEEFVRPDLPGWTTTLANANYDLVILDETHKLRGRPGYKKKGRTRNDNLAQLLCGVPRVWGLTGTPIYSYTRDLWSQFHLISGGLWSSPRTFDARYAAGYQDEYGWVNTGRSVYAETELRQRAATFLLKRERVDVFEQIPPCTRQVVVVEPEKNEKANLPKLEKAEQQAVMQALHDTFVHKIDAVVEGVLDELMEGRRVVVFSFLRANARRLYDALLKVAQSKQCAARLKQLNLQMWFADGSVSVKNRVDMGEKFTEHRGAGAFIASTDSFQEAASLRGASAVHFADLHWHPSAMRQAEDRIWDPHTEKIAIVYYVVKGSIDERVEAMVLSKLDTIMAVFDDKGAESMSATLSARGRHKKETVEDIWARLTAHIHAEET